MYRLLIEDLEGTWHDADLNQDEKIPFSFSACDIANLADRMADYSQEIAIPFTPRNARIFGYVNALQSTAKTPYKLLNARLLIDNIELAGKGAVCKINSITNNAINVQILSGLSNVSAIMKECVFADNTDTFGSCILPTFGGLGRDSTFRKVGYFPAKEKTPYREYLYPTIALPEITKGITKITGWNISIPNAESYSLLLASRETATSDSEIIQHESNESTFYYKATNIKPPYGEYSELSLTLCIEVDADYFDYEIEHADNEKIRLFDANFQNTIEEISTPTSPIRNLAPLIKTYIFDNAWLHQYDADGNHTANPLFIYNDNTKTYGLNFTIFLGGEIRKTGELYINGTQIVQGSGRYQPKDISFNFKFATTQGSKRMLETENVRFLFNLNRVKSQRDPDDTPLSMDFSPHVCNYADNLGWKNASELLIAFAQFTASTFVVNHDTKTIALQPINAIYANKKNALDWTDKLVNVKSRKHAPSGYAQHNIIAFAENKPTAFAQSYTFNIDNQNIENEKTLFAIAFDSRKDDLAYRYAKESKDGEITYKEEKANAPTLLTKDGATTLEESYTAVKKMAANALSIDCEINLSILDIANFSTFTPVFLAQFGAFFYVNKISNYQHGKTTDCELIKI